MSHDLTGGMISVFENKVERFRERKNFPFGSECMGPYEVVDILTCGYVFFCTDSVFFDSLFKNTSPLLGILFNLEASVKVLYHASSKTLSKPIQRFLLS
jgi:hypothetical protein